MLALAKGVIIRGCAFQVGGDTARSLSDTGEEQAMHFERVRRGSGSVMKIEGVQPSYARHIQVICLLTTASGSELRSRHERSIKLNNTYLILVPCMQKAPYARERVFRELIAQLRPAPVAHLLHS